MKGHQMAPTELQTSNGWILLHRSLLDSKEFSASPAQFKVLIYLILSANHKARFVRSVEINRGQCVRSLTRISDDCDLSRKAVRCALSNLAKSGFVNISTPFGAHQGHMITICNYDIYQSQRQGSGIEGINEGTREGNNEGTTNKNDKNGEEGKESRESAAPKPSAGNATTPKAVQRPRNPLMDALASFDGKLTEIGTSGWSRVAKALAIIREVTPEVTPQEITRRGRNYETHFDGAALTSTALAKHWAKCGQAKASTGPKATNGSDYFQPNG